MQEAERTFTVHFHDESAQERGRNAAELRAAVPAVRTRLEREDSSSMDLGTILVAVLSAKSVELFARGLCNWLERTRARVDIRNSEGHVILRNVSGRDAAEIVRALQAKGDAQDA